MRIREGSRGPYTGEITYCAGAGQCGDDISVQSNGSDPIIADIDNIKSIIIHAHSVREGQGGCRGLTAITIGIGSP